MLSSFTINPGDTAEMHVKGIIRHFLAFLLFNRVTLFNSFPNAAAVFVFLKFDSININLRRLNILVS